MSEWVAQDDWLQVKVGDTVRAMRAEQMLTGVVTGRSMRGSVKHEGVLSLLIEIIGVAEQVELDRAYWQLSVPAKPAIVLPDEAGWYSDRQGTLWRLNGHGEMSAIDTDSWLIIDYSDPKDYTPFTRVEPVAVTAKKVLDRFAAYWELGAPDDIIAELGEVGKEFGVTDD